MPLVSIIIPHFGHGRFLAEAVNSALQQTYNNIEIVVVDDGDRKEPASALLAHINDNRLRILTHDSNKGAAAARNTAIQNANGEFILPLDSDDILEWSYLKKTVPLINEDLIGGVYTAVRMFGLEESVSTNEWTVPSILKGNRSALVCMLFRKKIFDELGGYDCNWKVGEDTDFYLRAYKHGWRFRHLDEPLYLYRRHDRSTWHIATTEDTAGSLRDLAIKMAKFHKELYVEHLVEIVEHKEQRYWDLHREYQHLHKEFHKLLDLYNNLESGVRKAQLQQSLFGRIKQKFSRILGKQDKVDPEMPKQHS